MVAYRRSARRFLLTGACIASATVGMVAVWLFVPTGFKGFDTGDLLAVFALILFPLLTTWVVARDRAAQAEAAEQAAAASLAAQPQTLEPTQGQRAARKSVIHEPAYLVQPGEQQRV